MIQRADRHGEVTVASSVIGLSLLGASLSQGDGWTNKNIAAGLKGVDSLPAFAQFGSSYLLRTEFKAATLGSAEWAKASTAARGLGILKAAGPIADFIIAFDDGKSAAEAFKGGRIQEGLADSTKCGAAVVSGATTIGIYCGLVSGPVGWTVVAVAAVVYVGASIWKGAVAMDSDEALLRDLGVYEEHVSPWTPKRPEAPVVPFWYAR
jgi:hypothetical protein